MITNIIQVRLLKHQMQVADRASRDNVSYHLPC